MQLRSAILNKFIQFGFNCFLDHENIPPQRKWPAEIVEKLKHYDFFLPPLTPEFRASYYCQQEIGFAVGKRTEILPIMITIEPMGMIAAL